MTKKDSIAKLVCCDIDGILKGKLVKKEKMEKFDKSKKTNYPFCSAIFSWDCMDLPYENENNKVKITGEHTGVHDLFGQIHNSQKSLSWNNDIPIYFLDFPNAEVCPRSLLRKIISKFNQKNVCNISVGMEYEWFNLKGNKHDSNINFTNLTPITQGNAGYSALRLYETDAYLADIWKNMNKSNITLDSLHFETGPGILESGLSPSSPLEAADNAILFKHGIKEIAYKHNIIPNFMAKYRNDLQGCGGHIHLSIYDSITNVNKFSANYNLSSYKNSSNNLNTIENYELSLFLENWLAGQMYCLPQILPMFLPNVNSYKRLVEGQYAPTSVKWGFDNRTTTYRLINNDPENTRIETRICGADANPYLALSAIIASGMYGLENNLKLCEPSIGSEYLDTDKTELSRNLGDATNIMKNSSLAKKLFGENFVEHYCITREHEWKMYNKHISDWELNRYIDLI